MPSQCLSLTTLCLWLATAAAQTYNDLPPEVRQRMKGTRLDVENAATQGVERKELTETEYKAAMRELPKSFNAAEKWYQCANTINFIKDQSKCPSCWAVASSSMLADRFCTYCGYGGRGDDDKSKAGLDGVVVEEELPGFALSAEELLTCCRYCGPDMTDSCKYGGWVQDAMRYAQVTGLVSGGWYDSKCGCQAYKFNPLAESLTRGTPQCQEKCDSASYPLSRDADRHKVKAHQFLSGEGAMMKALYSRGTIVCIYMAPDGFDSFFNDPRNAKRVYTGQGGNTNPGGHAVKVVGWGEQEQDGEMVKFWLINNSWNKTWGDNGQFRYLRGVDLFDMEKNCHEAEPVCGSSDKSFTSLQCEGRNF